MEADFIYIYISNNNLKDNFTSARCIKDIIKFTVMFLYNVYSKLVVRFDEQKEMKLRFTDNKFYL